MSDRRRHVLMIAFHFPPMRGSSGIQRSLRFVQHLPALGWEPIVLTAQEHAYEETSDDLLAEVPAGVRVIRATAPNTARHLAIGGRYPAFLARPDRWKLWATFGTLAGRRAIAELKPDALWSTYPIASAHAIGAALQRSSGLPWIADFRDPMAQDGYPPDPKTWQSFLDIEARAVAQAARCVFVTPSALAMYRRRYGEAPAQRFALIENGYDESSFAAIEDDALAREPLNPGRITLLHSGIVYPSERDPTALFTALGKLRQEGLLVPGQFCIRFRAAIHEEMLRGMAAREAVSDLVEVLPAIPYTQALQEMLAADGLLVMQGANCGEQIPAKVYEYTRARRPVLGLTNPAGDTGALLAASGCDYIATLEDPIAVYRALLRFTEAIASGTAALPTEAAVAAASREARAKQLASLLSQAAS